MVMTMLLVAMAAAAGMLADLEGSWTGALEYRDYRSDKLVQIPVAVDNEMHGNSLIGKLVFTDPGFQVYRVSVTNYDFDAGIAYQAYIQDGGAERFESAFTFEETEDGWVITQTREGEDADKPATIREITTFSGDQLITERSVDPLGDGQDTFFFRNRSVLTRP